MDRTEGTRRVKFLAVKTLPYAFVPILATLACLGSLQLIRDDTHDIKVPEGYSLEVVADSSLIAYPMFGYVDETGRFFLFESTGNVYEKTQDALTDPQFRVNMLEDENGDGVYDKSTIFADKIGFPQGGYFYKGSLYVTSAPDLLKLTDTDGDGVSDKREVVLSGWALNVNANSLIGPFPAPDGWMYMTSAINGFDVTTKEGVRLKGETSRIWRVRPDGSDLEWVSAGGMNNPVELTFTEASEPIGTETYFTDPKAGQRDALVYWTEGGVYPKPNKNIDRDSLVRTGDLMPVVSKYSRVAPSGIGNYRSAVFGEDFKGNLFSAQFNTHRILRHKLFREGAGFRTEDEVFMWTDREDNHPTDVLEDADGSLLVVETGGWFIKGCPLSQVSKPELKGTIYRIRKKGSSKIDDPYGNKIVWSSLTASQLTTYAADNRPYVVDRAGNWIVDKGDEAVPSLIALFENSTESSVRTRITFLLSRIGTDKAMTAVRRALNDPDLEVRVAAARAAGLLKDRNAVDQLVHLVAKDEPAVRRQAATALGQIGDPRALPALLEGTATATDPFVRHALIYSLITFDQPAAIKKGLTHASPRVREAALIALDQMKTKSLSSGQVMKFLSDKSADLQRTALWVISHHPEWSHDVTKYLATRMKKGPLSENEKESFLNILIAFREDPIVQSFVTDHIKTGTVEQKLFLLQAMKGSQLKTVPQSWIERVDEILVSESKPEIKTHALEYARLAGVKGLGASLRKVVSDSRNSPTLRMEAIALLLDAEPALTPKDFDYLYSQLQAKIEAPLRLQSATVLSRAQLSDSQLLKLATDYLPQADAFILPRLVAVFRGKYSAAIGKDLVERLLNTPSLDSFTETTLRSVFENYPSEVQPDVEKLIAKLKVVQAERLKHLETLEKAISKGNIENGRQLYFSKAICFGCHTVGSEGGDLGPDLTSIQKDRSAHDLLEAIVYPNASFVREYETYQVVVKGNEYMGIIEEQSPEAITLKTGPETKVRIARKDIVSMKVTDVSMMPSGIDKLLSEQEMADLMAFLIGQDQDPSRDKALLR
jgi:putative membrane-bound dehydrogenase-like protein